METLKMSRKERDRLTIMAGVKPPGTDTGASRGDAGLEPPADQAGLATLSGRGRRGIGASVAGPAQSPAQAAGVAGASVGGGMRTNAMRTSVRR